MIQIIFDMFDHVSDFIEAKTPIQVIGLYYIFHLLPTLEYIIPASLLMGTLYTLWQMTRNNELTAMRTSGVSLFRIMRPFLAVGLAFSAFTYLSKEYLAPAASMKVEEFKDYDFKDKSRHKSRWTNLNFFNTPHSRVWDIRQFDIRKPGSICRVTVKQERKDGSIEKTIYADEGEFLDGKWWFFDGHIELNDKNDNPIKESRTRIPDLGREMHELTIKPVDLVSESIPTDLLPVFLSSRELNRYIRKHPRLQDSDVARLKTDLYCKTAIPWTCFIAVLLGIPAGIRSGRQSAMIGVILGVGLFFGFHMTQQAAIFIAKKQLILPWLGAWFPNIVFTTTGLFMVSKLK